MSLFEIDFVTGYLCLIDSFRVWNAEVYCTLNILSKFLQAAVKTFYRIVLTSDFNELSSFEREQLSANSLSVGFIYVFNFSL